MPKNIEVRHVSKSYSSGEDAVHVLEDISFTIDAQQFVCILGPSGCGKTTLLKMMDGLVSPSKGEVRIDGNEVTSPTEDAAVVFQNFGLFPWRTTTDNIAMGLEIQGYEKHERYEIAEELIERVGLSGFEDSYPNELSGGMQQRVGLARALAVSPQVLLLDEPFGALDALTKDQMQTQLLQLWEREQKTVVFVTHDIREAVFLADRVLVMSPKPSEIIGDLAIEFERPRWDRRLEIENADEFEDIELRLRSMLGLEAGEEPVTPQ